MIQFEATRPLQGSIKLRKVVMRFFYEAVVPIVDEWGSCTRLLHREDYIEVFLLTLEYLLFKITISLNTIKLCMQHPTIFN